MSERLKKLQKEGPAGQQKIQEYTRYATVGAVPRAGDVLDGFMAQGLVYPVSGRTGTFWWIMGIIGLTAGTIFLMWLGEQIDKYGIGNGIADHHRRHCRPCPARSARSFGFDSRPAGAGRSAIDKRDLPARFFFVVAGAILITQGQRRIPIQQAKHTRGPAGLRRAAHYLPLRVNHGGVMPIIFASSLMIFPSVILGTLGGGPRVQGLAVHLHASLPGEALMRTLPAYCMCLCTSR